MSGELQPFDTERYVEELSRIIGELGGIATRGSGLGTEVKKLTSEAEGILGILECVLWCATYPDREEALSDEDAESEQAMQDYIEDMESLLENREYWFVCQFIAQVSCLFQLLKITLSMGDFFMVKNCQKWWEIQGSNL